MIDRCNTMLAGRSRWRREKADEFDRCSGPRRELAERPRQNDHLGLRFEMKDVTANVSIDRSVNPEHDEQMLRPAVAGQRELAPFAEIVDLAPDVGMLALRERMEGPLISATDRFLVKLRDPALLARHPHLGSTIRLTTWRSAASAPARAKRRRAIVRCSAMIYSFFL